MTMIVQHHGIRFELDTNDWTDSASRQVAEDALHEGLLTLSQAQVTLIASVWTDNEAEIASREANDEVAQLIEAIENRAFSIAIKDWHSFPDSGHNCSITIDHD